MTTDAMSIDDIEARISGSAPIGQHQPAKPWVELIEGDCREALKTLDAESVDAVVTDPPYGLNFMGKHWDYDVPGVDIWREVVRELKPGGHLISFFGSRTYHRGVIPIEDAGFEIRDQIMWIYASGFPKSHDAAWDLHVQASQACGAMVEIDHGEQTTEHDLRFVRAAYLQTPVYACAKCGKVLQPFVPEQGAQEYRAAWSKCESVWPEQPGLEGRGNVEATARKLQGCEVCSLPIGVFADGAEGRVRDGAPTRRGEIPWQVPDADGSRPSYRPQSREQLAGQPDAFRLERRAQTFRGYGTALKPAHEPIVVARKPLIGTMAKNLERHGVGALNIDGCRVHGDDAQGGEYTVKRLKPGATLEKTGGNWRPEKGGIDYHGEMKPGRWPANVIHDGSDEVLAAFPQAKGQIAKAAEGGDRRKDQNVYGAMTRGSNGAEPRDQGGSAARFFYCAKASKTDRDEGLTGDEQPIITFATANGTSGKASSISEGRNTSRKNTHPTVKPTDLMRYLCRLVTPPGGTVLDPFMGSGSTGRGAVLEGFNFIGCEMEAAYYDIADQRIAAAEKEFMSAARH